MSWLLGTWIVIALLIAWEYWYTPFMEWHD